MRIIAGKFKGRKIDFPRHIRPTQDKVRQSLFDVLAGVVKDSRVLDLFSGSGALGLEALSRGAASAAFVDSDRRCSIVIAKNLKRLGLFWPDSKVVRNYTQDVFRAMRILENRKEVFDLVFLDPPYHRELAKKALKILRASGIVAPRGFIVAEHAKKDELGVPGQGVTLLKEFSHGDIKVSVFQVRGRNPCVKKPSIQARSIL